MVKEETLISSSATETQSIAKSLAITIQTGVILCLYGELGSGKTTFVQGFAKALGIEKRLISPTFIIMRTYDIESRMKNDESLGKSFYHVDLYRIEREKEIVDIGLLEIVHDRESLVAIEWPEKMGNLLPEKRIDITFSYIDDKRREVKIQKVGYTND